MLKMTVNHLVMYGHPILIFNLISSFKFLKVAGSTSNLSLISLKTLFPYLKIVIQPQSIGFKLSFNIV